MTQPLRLISWMAPGIPATLFETVADIVGAELQLITTTSGPPPNEDPFLAGDADLGWMCSTSFAELSAPDGNESVELVGVAWVPDDPGCHDRAEYFGDLVVPAPSAARSLADLAGQRIGCNDPVSLSGYHSLRFALEQRGLVAHDWADLVFTGGHNTSLDRLVAGEIDAAVVDSVARTRRSRVDADVAGLRVVERLGPWPTQPLAARRGLPEAEIARVRDALLAAQHEERLGSELRNAAMTRLTTVDPAHYQRVLDAMGV